MPVRFKDGVKRAIPGIVDAVEERKYRVKWVGEPHCWPKEAHGIRHYAKLDQDRKWIGKHLCATATFHRKDDHKLVYTDHSVFHYDTGDSVVRDRLRHLDGEDQNVWLAWGGNDKLAAHKVEGCPWDWKTLYRHNPGVFEHYTTTEDGVQVNVSYHIYSLDYQTAQAGFGREAPDFSAVSISMFMRDRKDFLVTVNQAVDAHRLIVKLRGEGREGEADLRYLRAKRDEDARRKDLCAKIKARRNQP